MKQITLEPVKSVQGEITLPGSKSLSNRALLLGALAEGETRLINLLQSDDVERMLDALRLLGLPVALGKGGTEARVGGGLAARASAQQGELDFFMGNAGTAIRPLTALLSLLPGSYRIDGDQYMRERPIGQLVDGLRQLGADIRYEGKEGCPPLLVKGGMLSAGKVEIPGEVSSQYVSALLMALPLLQDDSSIKVIGDQASKPYIDLTLGAMRAFGVAAEHDRYQTYRIPGGQRYKSPGEYLIEGDASSASYFFAAAAIAGGPVRVHGLGRKSVQGDYRFLEAIEQMGAQVKRQDTWAEVRRGALKGLDADLNHMPDAAMTLAAMALFAEGPTRIRNIYNWRVKETDRMHAMATGLRALGAQVATGDDYIMIDPPKAIAPATIETYGDHRIAMCFSLAALGGAPVTIKDPDCTRKTFPGYFQAFASIAA